MVDKERFQQLVGGARTIFILKRYIHIFEKQKTKAHKNGSFTKAKQISKKIQLLRYAIQELRAGGQVELNTLPDPKRNVFSVSATTKGEVVQDDKQSKNPAAPRKSPVKRKENYCILCQRMVKKFSEHVEQQHPESDVGQSLRNITGTGRERRFLKMKITDIIRKKWNDVYNRNLMNTTQKFKNVCEENKKITVKKRSKSLEEVPDVSCLHCDGLYRRDKLSVHLKRCGPYLDTKIPTTSFHRTNALKLHAVNKFPEIDRVSEEFKNEILRNKKINKVLAVAVNDPLIMQFGSDFHKSRRADSDKDYVMRVIRDITKLFILMKEKNQTLESFEDILNPVHFDAMSDAVLDMGKYNPESGSVKVPSIAYRLSQPLKDIASLAKKRILSDMYRQGGEIDRTSVTKIDDFLDMLNKMWKTVGRICTKSGKKRRVNRTDKIAAEEDIITLANYIEQRYTQMLKKLRKGSNKKKAYDFLVHMLVVHSMLLIRRRPIDFKHASLNHYTNIDKHDALLEMSKGYNLTAKNLEDCKRFHIFYVPGKNLEIVPIVFTPIMKNVCDELIKYRELVNINSNLLFRLSNNGSIEPAESIKFLKRQVTGLKRPDDLTGNGLRHQAATFSRLRSTHPQYQDYLASTLGHTLAVHKKHYELPMGILQKIIVCPILHDIMTSEKKGNTQSALKKLADRDEKKTKLLPNHVDRDLDNGDEFRPSTTKGKCKRKTTGERYDGSNRSDDRNNSQSSERVTVKVAKSGLTQVFCSGDRKSNDEDECGVSTCSSLKGLEKEKLVVYDWDHNLSDGGAVSDNDDYSDAGVQSIDGDESDDGKESDKFTLCHPSTSRSSEHAKEKRKNIGKAVGPVPAIIPYDDVEVDDDDDDDYENVSTTSKHVEMKSGRAKESACLDRYSSQSDDETKPSKQVQSKRKNTKRTIGLERVCSQSVDVDDHSDEDGSELSVSVKTDSNRYGKKARFEHTVIGIKPDCTVASEAPNNLKHTQHNKRKFPRTLLIDSDKASSGVNKSKNTKLRKTTLRVKSDVSEHDIDCGTSAKSTEFAQQESTSPDDSNYLGDRHDMTHNVEHDVVLPEAYNVLNYDNVIFSPGHSSSASTSSYSSSFSFMNENETKREGQKKGRNNNKLCNRTRWSLKEQATVFEEFGQMILKKICPSRGTVADFLKKKTELHKNRTVDQVNMFIRNHALRKQRDVTPTVLKYLQKEKV